MVSRFHLEAFLFAGRRTKSAANFVQRLLPPNRTSEVPLFARFGGEFAASLWKISIGNLEFPIGFPVAARKPNYSVVSRATATNQNVQLLQLLHKRERKLWPDRLKLQIISLLLLSFQVNPKQGDEFGRAPDACECN